MNAQDDLLARFTTFRVDGEDFPGGPMTWFFRRWAGGFFTADIGAVAERIPVPGLFPMRLTRGRSLLIVEGADLSQQRSGLPPTRGAFIAVSAMVTTDQAPLVAPLFSDRLYQRYQVGVVPLRFLITNHVEAQLFTGQFGFDMRTADIERRGGGRNEEFACWRDGRPVIRLRVRSDGRTRGLPPVLTFYSVRGGQPFRMSLANPNPGAARFGRRAAVLDLTDHEFVADLRQLRISRTGWLGVVKTGSRWRAETPPELLGDALPLARPPEHDFRPGRFIERLGEREAAQIDAELDALPFDPSSTIEVPPMPRP